MEGVEVYKKSNSMYEKLISIFRNTKVVKGGRKFSFSALVVVGNRKGTFGFGRGKAKDITTAIQKAVEKAKKKHLIVSLKSFVTIPHVLVEKYGATKIIMLPARAGTGVVAGSVLRSILYVVGIDNCYAKIIGSRNSNNITLAAVKCLNAIRTLEEISKERGIGANVIFAV